ncbi:hypothetical protein JHK85_015936 [Glycine max]|nr:hypothetical protein JHK85_015936 [Glycine max]
MDLGFWENYVQPKDNVRNQRENVVLMIANKQSRLGIPAETDPEGKTFNASSHSRCCVDMQKEIITLTTMGAAEEQKEDAVEVADFDQNQKGVEEQNEDAVVALSGSKMAKELDAILDHGEAAPAVSCVTDDGSAKFLEKIIYPIYQTLFEEADRNNNGKAAHSAWRNYDDFNEYFWLAGLMPYDILACRLSGNKMLCPGGLEYVQVLGLGKMVFGTDPSILDNYNAFTILSLWAPVVAIYLMDILIFYTIMSAIVGGVSGARARLGEDSQDMNKAYAAMFAPFWNEIIKSLREEDFISNRLVKRNLLLDNV